MLSYAYFEDLGDFFHGKRHMFENKKEKSCPFLDVINLYASTQLMRTDSWSTMIIVNFHTNDHQNVLNAHLIICIYGVVQGVLVICVF